MSHPAPDTGHRSTPEPVARLESALANELAAAGDRMWYVRAGATLEGTVAVAGAKNTATKLMIAACLADGASELHNVPDIADVRITAAMLEAAGAGVAVESSRAVVDGSTLTNSRVGLAYSGLNRMPILCLPVLLHRFGQARVPLVGGDGIGTRPVNFHQEALTAMGAEIRVDPDGITASGTLRGADITLPYPSVGATESVLLAAVLARGRTILHNAAVEPEIDELVGFLSRMGAIIDRTDHRRYEVDGVTSLQPAAQRIAGDRVEGFSYLTAGIATKGKVTVTGCGPSRMAPAVALLRRLGATVRIDIDGAIEAEAPSGLEPVAVSTAPWPGFATDWQPPLVAALTQADGLSAVHETVFENRLGYTNQLALMGATVQTFNDCLGSGHCRFRSGRHRHSALVAGPTKMHGAEVVMEDVRAGFGLAVAAVTATGDSLLTGVHHLERGYDNVLGKFRHLGADITTAPT